LYPNRERLVAVTRRRGVRYLRRRTSVISARLSENERKKSSAGSETDKRPSDASVKSFARPG